MAEAEADWEKAQIWLCELASLLVVFVAFGSRKRSV
jgi:hypothetical protein